MRAECPLCGSKGAFTDDGTQNHRCDRESCPVVIFDERRLRGASEFLPGKIRLFAQGKE